MLRNRKLGTLGNEYLLGDFGVLGAGVRCSFRGSGSGSGCGCACCFLRTGRFVLGIGDSVCAAAIKAAASGCRVAGDRAGDSGNGEPGPVGVRLPRCRLGVCARPW